MPGVKQMMVSTLISSMVVALMLANSLHVHAAPQVGALGAGGLAGGLAGGAAGGLAGGAAGGIAGGAAGAAGGATSTTTTTTSSSSSAAAAGGAVGGIGGAGAAGAAGLGGLAGVQGLVGGALNIASMPLNTITASLNQLGLPTIATAPLSAVSSLFQQAGNVYGR